MLRRALFPILLGFFGPPQTQLIIYSKGLAFIGCQGGVFISAFSLLIGAEKGGERGTLSVDAQIPQHQQWRLQGTMGSDCIQSPKWFCLYKNVCKSSKTVIRIFFFLSNLSHFTFLCSRKAWAVFFKMKCDIDPEKPQVLFHFFWFTLYLRIYSEVKQTKPVPPLQNNPRESISVSSDLILLIPGARACFGNLRRRILINHSQKN